MLDWPLLTLTIFLPTFGAFFIFFIRNENPEIVTRNARYVAMWVSGFTFVLSLLLLRDFDFAAAGDFQFVNRFAFSSNSFFSYYVGVDGISLAFILLSTFLTPLCILSSKHAIKKNVKEFMIAFLLLETFMIGTFSSLNLVIFYIFFEAVLIPMFLIIGIWGGERRVYAAFKFFLYTLLGSVLMLIAIMVIHHKTGTSNIPELMFQNLLDPTTQKWLWVAFFASFAVKVPMWPVHTWLPDAHVEAPTAGSVILAGVLLKMGGYGFLRLSLPILPDASVYFAPFMFVLSVLAIIVTSLIAFAQKDMKKLIAYSSVAHMGFVTLGLFALNLQGIQGAIMVMISHGLVSAALFLCVGVVYDRLHTREIARYGGLVKKMPVYATVFMFFIFASVGLPGTSGFVGEFLSLVGVFQANKIIAAFATLGVILGAVYSLWLYREVVFGVIINKDLEIMKDLTLREKLVFIPLIVMTLFFGIYPKPLLQLVEEPSAKIVAIYTLPDTLSENLVRPSTINIDEKNNQEHGGH